MDKKQLQQRVTEQRRRVRRRLTIRGVLSLLVVLTFIRCAFMQRYENMFVCVLSLVLLAMPTLIEKQLAIDIPPMMEAIIYCFIYAAEIHGRDQLVLHHHSRMGHHAAHDKRISGRGGRLPPG